MVFGNLKKQFNRHRESRNSKKATERRASDMQIRKPISAKYAFLRPKPREAKRKEIEPAVDLALERRMKKPVTKQDTSAWTLHWEAVNRGDHIRERPNSSLLLSTFASLGNQLPQLLNALDLNKDIGPQETEAKTMSIPQSWFRSATDPFNKEDQKLRGNVDSRFPMIVLSGLPGVGKTVIARELANILEESDRSLVPGNEKRMTLVETAWSFFQDPRPRSRPGSHDAGHPGCMRDTYSGPVEHFAGGKAIVVNVDHLSCEQSIQEREQRERRADTRRGDGFGSTRATTEVSEKPLSKADKEIAGSLSWYCTSLASLDPSRNHDPETIRCLDKGRRLALEKYIMPEQNNNSTAIFTECLFQDDRNGASEYAAKAYKTAADVFERRLIPIYLTCDAKEHQRRFGCRETEMRQKLIASESQKAIGLLTPSEAEVLARGNIDSIEAMLKNVTNKGEDVLYYFSKPADYKDDKYFLPKEVGPTGELGSPQMPENYQGCRIDTTGLTPLEVAGIIQKFCEDVMRGKAGQTLVSWGVHLWPELEEEDKKDGGNKKLEKKGISKDWQMVAPLNGEPAE